MNILRASILATAAAAALLVACSSGDGSTDSQEPTQSAEDGLHRKCVQTQMCIVGDHWDSKSCKCVPDGVACGSKTCAAGEYCCSSSCGICEKIGAMCPAIACKTPL
jgi:hypothetical protein